MTKDGKITNGKSENCVPIVAPGFSVNARPRSDADAASEDRAPTASGEREQDLPDCLQPFTGGLAEGESGTSCAAGETFPSTHPPHIPPRHSNNYGGKDNLFIHFPKDPNSDTCTCTKITRAPCRKNLDNREDQIPQAKKIIGIPLQRISQFSMKRSSRDCITDIR